MKERTGWWRRLIATAVTVLLVALGVLALVPRPAAADQRLPASPSWITNSAKDQRVKALAKLGNTLYVGGEFSTISPAPNMPVLAQRYLFAVDATTGVYRSQFAPLILAPPGTELDPSGVLALEVDPAGGSLFVGGTFTSVNGMPLAGFAILDPATGALKASADQRSVRRIGNGLSGVNALLRVESHLYLGGEFDQVGAAPRQNVARLDLASATTTLDPWIATTNAPVFSLAADPIYPQRIYVGGIFTAAGPVPDPQASFLAAFDTGTSNTLLPWYPRPDGGDKPGTVQGLDAVNGRVYAAIAGGGGQFNVYDGTLGATKILVKQMRATGNLQAVNVIGDTVFVGGHHDNWISPVLPQPKLAAFRADTLEPLPTPAFSVAGAWGIWAILGDSPNDVWWGGELRAVTELGGSGQHSTGNLLHLRDGHVVDQQAPSAPGRPSLTNGLFSSVQLSWLPATDDRFVSAYQVYVNGVAKTVASGLDTSATVSGLPASTSVQITVRALDGGRNLGPASPSATITTGPAPPPLPSPLKGFGQFYAVDPLRVLDTRAGLGVATTTPVPAGQALPVKVAGVGQVPATGVAMLALNVTVTQPTAPGYLTVYPGGEAVPSTSNLNFGAGQTVPNLVVARVPASGLVNVLVSAGAAHVLVDVVGWFGSATTPVPGSKIAAQVPTRVYDSRALAKVGAGQSVEVQVVPPGSSVNGVVVNLTGVDPTTGTYVTVYPGDLPGPPNASNLNLVPAQVRPNLVMVRVPTTGPQAGRIKLFNASGSTHLIVDLLATFTRAAAFDNDPAGRLLPLDSPVRLIDTRAVGGPLAGPGQRVWDLRAVDEATPAPVAGLVVNATATRATAATFLTLYPAGNATPGSSNLNVAPGEDVPNAAVLALSAGDGLAVFNQAGSVHYLLDVSALVLG